jgi:hypothetical protein
MVSNLLDSRKRITLIGLWTSCVGAVLAGALLGGLSFPPANDRAWEALLLAMSLVGIAVLGVAVLSRARAVRKLKAAMDHFAEQEIARARRRKRPNQVWRSL